MKCETASDLDSALGVGSGGLVSLVGGGGKTTAMYRLTSLLRRSGIRAAAATTTKIAPPDRADGATLLCEEAWSELRRQLSSWDWSGLPPVLGMRLLSSRKVQGLPAEWCDRLLAEDLVDALVVEADGAARKPVKAPEAWEPVVPEATTHFVAVLGLSCAGAPLNDEIAFRAERIARLTGLAPGSPLTVEALAVLLTAPDGLLKGCPAGARRTALLNQADLAGARDEGRRIADEVLKRSSAVDRVLVASLGRPGEPIEVWKS